MAGSDDQGVGFNPLFTLGYAFFSACVVTPPTEIMAAGFTVQNVLANYLGSEDLHFIYYHIKRTTATVVVHSLLPLGYYIGMMVFDPELSLYLPWRAHYFWKLYLAFSIAVPICMGIMTYHWSRQNWNNHPIAKTLGFLGNGNPWRSVASSINVEFRRFDKFTSGVHGRRVYVTDSWVLKVSTYLVHIAHHNDIHLTLAGSDEHDISYDSGTSVQYLNIVVGTIHEHLKPFSIRLNSLEYSDLRVKLSTPVRNARDIVIQQSLSDKFLEAFRAQIQENGPFRLPDNMEVEQCIGCMQKAADVKLVKWCSSGEEGECRQCYCRPMWCLECMSKWFASRQDQHRPETWLGSRSPCPTCRAPFCVLDVCRIVE